MGFIAVMLALGGAGCTSGICDSSELSTALASALRGETVHVGECRLAGSFTVPAGVTLEGSGRDRTVLVSAGEDAVIRLEGGDQATRVIDLTVESDGIRGILASGDGAAAVERVTIEARRGIGIAVGGLDSITIASVTLRGPITPSNAADLLSPPPTPEDTATHGLVLNRVAEANLEDVEATGFAMFGVLFIQSDTRWQGGGAWSNLGTGLLVQAGSAVLRDLRLCGTLEPQYAMFPAYEGVYSEGAVVETHNVTVCESQGIGLLHDSASAEHFDLVATDNAQAAVWAQRCKSIDLNGATSLIGNGVAGVVLVETASATIKGGHIDTSRLVSLACGGSGGHTCEVGDGVQVVDPGGTVRLEDLSLSGNARVGVLVAIAATATGGVDFEDVQVNGEGEQLGAIGQGAGVEPGWDQGVTRLGATVENDPAWEGGLGVVLPKQEFEIPTGDDVIPYLE